MPVTPGGRHFTLCYRGTDFGLWTGAAHLVDAWREEVAMQTRPGDRLVIKGHRVGEAERRAEILRVRGSGNDRSYYVRWADGHEGWIYPGSDAVVEHREMRKRS